MEPAFRPLPGVYLSGAELDETDRRGAWRWTSDFLMLINACTGPFPSYCPPVAGKVWSHPGHRLRAGPGTDNRYAVGAIPATGDAHWRYSARLNPAGMGGSPEPAPWRQSLPVPLPLVRPMAVRASASAVSDHPERWGARGGWSDTPPPGRTLGFGRAGGVAACAMRQLQPVGPGLAPALVLPPPAGVPGCVAGWAGAWHWVRFEARAPRRWESPA